MNPKISSALRKETGTTLIETIIYMGVLAVLMVLAYQAYYQTVDSVRRMNQNADDILRMQNVGERWRQAIRSTSHHPLITTNEQSSTMTLEFASGQSRFVFEKGVVRREASDLATPEILLTGVRACEWFEDQAVSTRSWRWEVELETKRSSQTMRPRFTFQAVAGLSLVSK